MNYKVIKTGDFVKSVNPKPSERTRVEILNDGDRAQNINGIFGSLPPASPGGQWSYHHHRNRESIIQILSGDATEMIEGTPVQLKPGEVIFIPPNVKHALLNNSSTEELKYMEFFSPIAADTVRD